MVVLFNKYYFIYLKAFITSKVTHWTLFSYTVDKYYVSINKLLKYQKAHFLKYLSLIYSNQNHYIDDLIKFKRSNSTFKTHEDFGKYLFYQLCKYTNSHMINFISTDIVDNFSSDVEESASFDNYIHPNPFEFKIKNLISYNRKLLIHLFNFKLKRQYRITRFIANIIKYRIDKTRYQINFNLLNILFLSKFILNSKQGVDFVKNGCVYVNGVRVSKPTMGLIKGDNIQLVLAPAFYAYYFYQFNGYLKVTLKYHNKFFKGDEVNFSKITKNPNTALMIALTSFKQGIPRYLEVDFLTWSSVVIYKPNNTFFINNYMHYIYNFYLNRLYNWKFIS